MFIKKIVKSGASFFSKPVPGQFLPGSLIINHVKINLFKDEQVENHPAKYPKKIYFCSLNYLL